MDQRLSGSSQDTNGKQGSAPYKEEMRAQSAVPEFSPVQCLDGSSASKPDRDPEMSSPADRGDQAPARGFETAATDSHETGSDPPTGTSDPFRDRIDMHALRNWFHQPRFNRSDGLDDYDGDYGSFTPLGEIVTAHMRHQMQRLADPAAADRSAKTTQRRPETIPATVVTATPAVPEPRTLKHRESVPPPVVALFRAPDGATDPEAVLLWNADKCACGSTALPGCTRCKDACGTGAIFFDNCGLKIRPERCRGGGTCVAACPTGALHTGDHETPRLLKQMLNDIRKASYRDEKPLSAIFCEEGSSTRASLQRLTERLPAQVLAIPGRLSATPGPEAWLAALAMGARRVIVLAPAFTAVQRDGLELAQAIIGGLGEDAHVRLLAAEETRSLEAIDAQPAPAPFEPAAWEPSDDKRTLLWQAVAHLHGQVAGAPVQAALAAGAPFGAVALDTSSCTLCMACVGACPTGALRHGAPGPQLRFREQDCIQCDRCRQVCPEQAITLIPRICYDPNQAGHARILHQDEPLRCSVCGTPFATAGIVNAITRKLSAHRMYQEPSARKRLSMCRDCRIRSSFASP